MPNCKWKFGSNSENYEAITSISNTIIYFYILFDPSHRILSNEIKFDNFLSTKGYGLKTEFFVKVIVLSGYPRFFGALPSSLSISLFRHLSDRCYCLQAIATRPCATGVWSRWTLCRCSAFWPCSSRSTGVRTWRRSGTARAGWSEG